MNFQLQILLISFITSIISGLIVIPILRKLKVGQIEREDGPQSHLKKQGTPTMGGTIMIITLILISIATVIQYIKSDIYIILELIPLVLVSIGFGLIGFIDDFKKLVLKNTDGLKPMYKMIGLLIISVSFIIYLIMIKKLGTETLIPIIKTYINIPIFIYIPCIIFIMLGTTNAINLTDGVDGLATGVTTIIVATLTAIGIMYGVKEVVILGSIVCGTNMGFLIFNMHPAKVFMGDTGSLMLGGVIVSMAIYLQIPLLLVLIAIVPVIETLSVMIQVAYFKKTGKRVFKMTPIHHHFELSGWNENKIVIVFSTITLVACILGFFIV